MKKVKTVWEENKEKLPVGYNKLYQLDKNETKIKIDYSRKSFQFDKYPVDFKDDQIYDKIISNIVIDE